MKAILFDPPNLRPAALPRPTPTPDQILLRVVASGVSRLDLEIVRGERGRAPGDSAPWVPGCAVAGVVEEVGASGGRFRRGDRVWASTWSSATDRDDEGDGGDPGGGYAEFVAVGEEAAAPMPNKLLFEEAAAIPLHGVAAWGALFECLRLDAGGTLRLIGAAGGVGHLAVQLARSRGISVTAVCREEARDFVRDLGAEECRSIDEPGDRLADGVLDLRPSVADDADPWPCLDGVREGAPWLTTGHDAHRRTEPPVGAVRPLRLTWPRVASSLDAIARLVDEKRLRPTIAEIFPLRNAAEAHERLVGTPTRGVVTLNL